MPVLVLGFGAGLSHMLRAEGHADERMNMR
jgi:hypothetical protein